MGGEKTAEQIAHANGDTIEGVEIGNAPGAFFRGYGIIDKIGRTQIDARPKRAGQRLDNQEKVYLP